MSIENLKEKDIVTVKLKDIEGIIPEDDKYRFTYKTAKEIEKEIAACDEYFGKNFSDKKTLLQYIGEDRFIELYSKKIIKYIRPEQKEIYTKDQPDFEMFYNNLKDVEQNPIGISSYEIVTKENLKDILQDNDKDYRYASLIKIYVTDIADIVIDYVKKVRKENKKKIYREDLYLEAIEEFEKALEKYNSQNNNLEEPKQKVK